MSFAGLNKMYPPLRGGTITRMHAISIPGVPGQENCRSCGSQAKLNVKGLCENCLPSGQTFKPVPVDKVQEQCDDGIGWKDSYVNETEKKLKALDDKLDKLMKLLKPKKRKKK